MRELHKPNYKFAGYSFVVMCLVILSTLRWYKPSDKPNTIKGIASAPKATDAVEYDTIRLNKDTCYILQVVR